MKKIFITGACGFIGSHLVELFLKKNLKVIAYDLYNSNNNFGWLNHLKENNKLKIILGDVSDFKSLENSCQSCDTIIHLASLIGIPYSYTSPSSYLRTNINGTYNILELAIRKKIDNVLITSTSEVYGEQKYLPIDENHPIEASSPYAATKIAADNLALSYYKSFGLPIKIIRPFNVYGPRQSQRAIIPTIIMQILNKNKNIKLGNLHPSRDYTFVKDTCDAIYQLGKMKNKGKGQIFNIGNKKSYKIIEIAEKIKKIMKSNMNIKLDKNRVRPYKSEVDNLECENKKIKKFSKWKSKYSFDNGLKETIKWFELNKDNISSKKYTI